jgi:hypothetical protein
LLLDRHDLHDFVLQLIFEKEIDDFCFFNGQGEKENFFDGSDLSLFDETSKLGDGHPNLFLASTPATTASAAPTTTASSTATSTSKTTTTFATAFTATFHNRFTAHAVDVLSSNEIKSLERVIFGGKLMCFHRKIFK